ncbi:MAG: type II toxin-antitoxin system HicA family toxin [Methanosarcinaceae archaeon]|nr:type II toxin-antitoxin system HicA family toxin [Methanosarcinaceae archaeon]
MILRKTPRSLQDLRWELRAKLPVLSGREVINILAKVGFIPLRQKGSHVILVNDINGNKKAISCARSQRSR